MDQTTENIETLKKELEEFKDEITRMFGGDDRSQWKNDLVFLAIKAVELKKSTGLINYLKQMANEHLQSLIDEADAFDRQYEKDRELQAELKERGVPVHGEVSQAAVLLENEELGNRALETSKELEARLATSDSIAETIAEGTDS